MDFSKRTERFAKTYELNEELYSWLRKEDPETIVDPDLPIIDTHHHFWDHRLKPDKFFFTQVYLLPECLEDMNDGHNVTGTVFTQAGAFFHKDGPVEFRPCGEVEFCQGVAAMCESGIYGPTRLCQGIQGEVDLHHPNAPAVLERMMKTRNFRGIRAWGPFDENFRKGLQFMQDNGLVLDYQPFPIGNLGANNSIAELKQIAKEFPKLQIVCCHNGKIVGPRVTPEETEKWKADMKDLADSCPNVVCKVGGGPTNGHKVNGVTIHKLDKPVNSDQLCEMIYPWYAHNLTVFGADRVVWESNFPVEKNATSMRVLINACKKVCIKMGMSYEDKKKYFHDNAVRVYKLNTPSNAKL